MRPVLSVRVEPPAPMKELTSWHVRVGLAAAAGHAVLQRQHGGEGDVFRRFGRHLDLADVLLGEEALGHASSPAAR